MKQEKSIAMASSADMDGARFFFAMDDSGCFFERDSVVSERLFLDEGL